MQNNTRMDLLDEKLKMCRKMKGNKAFTLIELLVVIVIIGILATVVVANVSSAQSKAKDAKVKSDMNTVQTAAALYFNEHGDYAALSCSPLATNTCDSTAFTSNLDTNIQSIGNAAKDISSVNSTLTSLTVIAAGNSYQAFAPLSSTLNTSNLQSSVVSSSGSSTQAVSDNTIGLVAYWPLDDASGADSSGNNVTATLAGTTSVGGKFGNARNFNGTSDYITLDQLVGGTSKLDQYFDTGKDWTVALWMNTSTFQDDGGIFFNRYGASQLFGIVTNSSSNSISFSSRDSTGNSIGSGVPSVSVNNWHLLTISRKYQGNITFMFDNTIVNQAADSRIGNFISLAGNHEYFLGKKLNPSDYVTYHYFKGSIDDVRIFNRALTVPEVQSMASQ